MKVVLISVTYTVAGRGKVWQVKVRERLRAPARVPRRGGGRAGRLLHVVQGVAVDSIVPGVSVIISRRQVAAASILGKYIIRCQGLDMSASLYTEGIVLGTFFIM